MAQRKPVRRIYWIIFGIPLACFQMLITWLGWCELLYILPEKLHIIRVIDRKGTAGFLIGLIFIFYPALFLPTHESFNKTSNPPLHPEEK